MANLDAALQRICSAVYLDYNASAPLDSRVLQEMLPVLADRWGNASSVHRFGRQQAAVVDDARSQTARLVGGRPGHVVFTAGATEANNLALCGVARTAPAGRRRMLVSAVEHASISNTARWLAQQALAKVDVIPVAAGGALDMDALDALLGDDVLLVSVMAANSETGVLNPIAEIARRVHQVGALVHCDATQFAGRLTFDLTALGVDLVSVSSHKICGPGGVGALVGTKRSLSHLEPVIHGGGHERGLRSGSLNVPGIVGFGAAAAIAVEERSLESQRVAVLRDRLVADLMRRLPDVCQNGDPANRLSNTANLRFAGADAEAVVSNMDPVAASTGSACSSGSIDPSRVLLAMGITREAAFESVRFSLGRFTTSEEIALAVDQIVTAVRFVRSMNDRGEPSAVS